MDNNGLIGSIIVFINILILSMIFTFISMWYSGIYTMEYFIRHFVDISVIIFIGMIVLSIVAMFIGDR
jgi:hypothetical protein